MDKTWKSSSMNSISMSHPCPISLDGHVDTELEIEPTRLDFRKWSLALHVLPWVQLGTCFPLCPSHYISDIEYTQYSSHFSSSQYTQFSKCTLNPLYYTHLTQHLRYTILYLLVFFVKKNLEHIRKSYALFIYFFC